MVNVLGLRYLQQGQKRIMAGVILDADTDYVLDTFRHITGSAHDDATQARELRDALSSALRPFELAAGVLFEADYHPSSRVNAGTKLRLRLEGAALTAALDCAPIVQVMNGPQVGRACSTDKDGAINSARSLGVEANFVEAAAAALAAKSIC